MTRVYVCRREKLRTNEKSAIVSLSLEVFQVGQTDIVGFFSIMPFSSHPLRRSVKIHVDFDLELQRPLQISHQATADSKPRDHATEIHHKGDEFLSFLPAPTPTVIRPRA